MSAGAGGYALAALRSRRLARAFRILGLTAVGVAALSAIGFGALLLRLSYGPIEVDGLGTRVADALTRRFDGAIHFTFGATRIARTAHGPTITVDRLKAVADGRTVVEAPRAELSLDPLALLHLEALPRRLEVLDLVVRLMVLPDGALAISAGGPNEEAIVLSRPGAPSTPDLQKAPGQDDKMRRTTILKEAAGALRSFFDLATSPKSPLAAIHLVAVRGGKLVFDDRTADRTTTFGNLDMAFEKGLRQTTFHMKAQGPNGEIATVARARGTPDTERRLDIELRGVSADEIALVAGARRHLVDSDAHLSLQLRFVLEPNQVLREASGRVLVSPGYVRMEDPDHEPLFFDEITGAFRWDTVNQRIIVGPVQFFSGETQFVAQGTLDPPPRPDDGWKIALGLAKPGGFAPERPNEGFLQIAKADIDARLRLDQKRLDIARAEIAGPDVALAAAGAIDWVDGPHVRAGVSAGRMPLRALLRIWPTLMGAPARTWLIAHAHAMVENAKLKVDFDKNALLAMRFDRPPPDKSLEVDFSVSDGVVSPVAGIPDVVGLAGTGHVTGRTAHFQASAGTMQTSPQRKLTLSDGSFSLPWNDGSRATPARVEAHVAGSIEAVSELLNRDAIKPFASMPLDPASLKGQVDGKLKLDFKVGPDARDEDVKVYVNADVANFAADHLIGKEKFDSGTLSVVGDPTGVKATGKGRIFGAPATLDLRKGIGQPATANLNGTVEQAARAKLGLDVPGVTGPIGLKIAATLQDSDTRAGVDLDLTKAAIANPIPGLNKPAGRSGRASFTLIARDKGIRLDNIVVDAGGAKARGSAELAADGALHALRLSQVKLSAGDDMRVDVQRSGEAYKATVRGSSIDARPFLENLVDAGAGAPTKEPDFSIDLKTPILSGFSKQALLNADLKMSRKDGKLRQFAMSGQFGRAPFSASLGAGQSGPQIDVSTSNAGAFLAFTNLYSRMEGGALTAAIALNDASTAGMLKIKSFHLRDEPALRRLVVESNPRDQAANAPATARVDPALVKFDRLQLLFVRSSGKLQLRDGVMNGPNIGLTVEGSVDTARDLLALHGTFVPAYTVNNFFSKIPVVGILLGGGWNEGLFAVNYKVSGQLTSPHISVNPLTVAPGFLRKIFGVFDNAAPSAPATAAPNAAPAPKSQ